MVKITHIIQDDSLTMGEGGGYNSIIADETISQNVNKAINKILRYEW